MLFETVFITGYVPIVHEILVWGQIMMFVSDTDSSPSLLATDIIDVD